MKRRLLDKIALQLKAEAAGHESVDLALEALRESKGFGNVPSDFTIAPSQWLVSRSANNIDGNDTQRTSMTTSVTTIQAQELLRKLLPLIDELCNGATEASVESLREGFFTLSYNSIPTELLKIIAVDREGNNKITHSDDKEFCPPVGELILAYEYECRPWLNQKMILKCWLSLPSSQCV